MIFPSQTHKRGAGRACSTLIVQMVANFASYELIAALFYTISKVSYI